MMALEFANIFPNEFLDKLPLSAFTGTIEVIDTMEAMENAYQYLQYHTCLGFDTETKPSFKKGKINVVSLLQLSTHDHAFLFRLNRIGLPVMLYNLLTDKKITKVGIAIRDDINALKKLHLFEPSNFIDLQPMVTTFGIEEKSLKKLAAIVLNIRITKGQQTSNWENEVLTEPQQIYAATDAWVCYEIYQRLKLCSP